jgi:hypothetical protein
MSFPSRLPEPGFQRGREARRGLRAGHRSIASRVTNRKSKSAVRNQKCRTDPASRPFVVACNSWLPASLTPPSSVADAGQWDLPTSPAAICFTDCLMNFFASGSPFTIDDM